VWRNVLQVVYTHCAGLDVHKKTVVACARIVQDDGTRTSHIHTFPTTTAGLLLLVDWLLSLSITHVAMESTAEFWKPVYNLLEGSVTVLVVNAHHIKQVPGRKTDVKDAEWIAELLAHGLLRASFVPDAPQRALRDLTRQRTHLVQERARVVNRMQKVLEWANIKLAAVVTDVTGVSARAMLEALVAGQTDVTLLADLAQGRLRAKRAELEQALRGTLQAHHAFMITQHLAHLDFLEEQGGAFDSQIEAMIQASGLLPTAPLTPQGVGSSDPVAEPAPTRDTSQWAAARTMCDTVPGIGPRVAETIVAELGIDMSRFPSAAQAASWAGLAPGQNESAGKRRAVRIGKGNGYLKSALIQAAWAAIKVKDSFLAAFYRRVAARRGNKKAIVAVAHKILVIVYTLLKTGEPYQERGVPMPDERQKERLIERMQRRIAQLGYKVNLEPIEVAAS
jgi:transposase